MEDYNFWIDLSEFFFILIPTVENKILHQSGKATLEDVFYKNGRKYQSLNNCGDIAVTSALEKRFSELEFPTHLSMGFSSSTLPWEGVITSKQGYCYFDRRFVVDIEFRGAMGHQSKRSYYGYCAMGIRLFCSLGTVWLLGQKYSWWILDDCLQPP